MKNDPEFQRLLFNALKREPELRVPEPPWSEEALSEIVWIVRAFLSSPKSKVRNEELLNDLLDRFHFRTEGR